MLTHDALNTYVADRQQARVDAATAARTGRLLRRARAALGASGPAGSAAATAVAAAPVPTSSDPALHPDRVGSADAAVQGTASSPVVAPATGTTTGTLGDPAVAVLRTAATAGDPTAQDGPAAA